MSIFKRVPFKDLTDLQEDERIELIGQTVTDRKLIVGVFVESSNGKSDRYIKKLLQRFSDVEIVGSKEVEPGITLIQVGPRTAQTERTKRQ